MSVTAVNLIQIAHVPFRSMGLMMKAKIHFQAIRGFLIYLFVFLIYLLYLENQAGLW